MGKTGKSGSFKRVLNTGDILVVAFGAMIGWGWVVSSGGWIQNAGVMSSVLGFVIGGVMLYFVGLTYAELTPALPKAGGEHVFSYKAFGATGSFVCTWALILSYVGVVCFEACSLPTIVQYIFPGFVKGYMYSVAGFKIHATWVLLATVVTLAITWVNIRGIKAAAVLQTILTVTIALVGILLVAASAFRGSPANLEGQWMVGGDAFGAVRNILSVAAVAPFFLMGFDVIPQVAEEINIPLKRIGWLLLASILFAVAFYALVIVGIGYVLDSGAVAKSMEGSGLVAADAMAKAFGSNAMAKVLIVGGLCGIATSWNAFFIGGSRAIFSMAKARMIPGRFSKVHPRYKTPVNALLLICVLSLIAPFFGKTALVWIADTASFACCIAYGIVALSFLRLRLTAPDMHRPFKIRLHWPVGIVAALMSSVMVVMFILPGTGCTLTSQEWVIVGGWTVLGILFYASSRIVYKERFGTVDLSSIGEKSAK